MSEKTSVLFLCTGNSCRSQMAEGLLRHFHGDRFEVFSAGIETHGLNPLAVRAMGELGIDISGHRSKTLDDLADLEFELVVTVCSHAAETCPVFPGQARVIHQGFDDPPKLAADAISEDEAMAHYRRVRDQIATFTQNLPNLL